MNNVGISMMADIFVYSRKLRGWSKFIWYFFGLQKWWVHGYERGWNSARDFNASEDLKELEKCCPDVIIGEDAVRRFAKMAFERGVNSVKDGKPNAV